MMLFLNMSEPCNALPAEVQSLGRQDYQILAWQCGDKKFKIWQKACEGKYWSRPFFLEEENFTERHLPEPICRASDGLPRQYQRNLCATVRGLI